MSSNAGVPARPSAMSRALARDRLGVPAVLFFVLAGVAPLTVAAGVIPTAYADHRADRHPGRVPGHRASSWPCSRPGTWR